MEYTIKNINGLETIFVNMPGCNSTTIQILVKAGSIYETKGTNGISHFLEHMFFKGGKIYKDPKSVAEAIDEIGGEFNAFTGDEYAGYYVKSSPDYLNTAIKVLGDMLVNAQFNKDELEREKGVIIQEIMMYEDLPHKLVVDKWNRFYYGDNSYGRSTLGPVENIKKFDQKDFFEHKEKLYTKDNLIIIIAGEINNIDEISEQINDNFSGLGDKTDVKTPILNITRPSQNIDFLNKGTEQAHIVIGANGFNIFEQDRYAANLLGVILGGNMSSRLFQQIREKKGLCYYISGMHFPNTQDGLFFIKAGIEKDRLEYGLEEIIKEIQLIANGDIKQDEFEKSLGYIKGRTQMGIETSDQMADFVGEQYLIKKQITSLDEILKKYQKLNILDLMKISNKLLKENLYTYYIK